MSVHQCRWLGLHLFLIPELRSECKSERWDCAEDRGIWLKHANFFLKQPTTQGYKKQTSLWDMQKPTADLMIIVKIISNDFLWKAQYFSRKDYIHLKEGGFTDIHVILQIS